MARSPDWTSVAIRKETHEEIKVLLKNDEIKRQGIGNTSQFIMFALAKYMQEIKRNSISHINMYDDHVKIMDRGLEGVGRIVSVYFNRDGRPHCDYCEEPDCIHVQFAWEIPAAREVLERHGFKPPPSRLP